MRPNYFGECENPGGLRNQNLGDLMRYTSIVPVLLFGASSLAAIGADPNYPQGSDRMKDKSETSQQQPAAGETDSATGAKQNSPRETPNDAAYSADVKKCDSMQGNDRKDCITAAKKKAGQM